MNIVDKIFRIMNEYDELLEKKKNLKNLNNNINENNISKEKENIINEIDDSFLKYIYKNINIKNINEEPINSNENNEEKYKEDNENMNYKNNDQNNYQNFLNKNINNNNINDKNIEKKGVDNNFNVDVETENEIDIFLKKIYKKLILKCHPDKNGNEKLFLKCQEYYENKFLIGLLYIGYMTNYKLPTLNQKIINQILFEIRVIQEKIINLKLEIKKNIDK